MATAKKKPRRIMFTLIYGHQGLTDKDKDIFRELDAHLASLPDATQCAEALGLGKHVQQIQCYFDDKNGRLVFSGTAPEPKEGQAFADIVCDLLNLRQANGKKHASTWILLSLNDLWGTDGQSLPNRGISGSSGIG